MSRFAGTWLPGKNGPRPLALKLHQYYCAALVAALIAAGSLCLGAAPGPSLFREVSKPCTEGCEENGNCNGETGECECPFGLTGTLPCPSAFCLGRSLPNPVPAEPWARHASSGAPRHARPSVAPPGPTCNGRLAPACHSSLQPGTRPRVGFGVPRNCLCLRCVAPPHKHRPPYLRPRLGRRAATLIAQARQRCGMHSVHPLASH